MRRILVLGCAIFCFLPSFATATPLPEHKQQETVILLHGLGRTSRSMRMLERTLAEEGYHIVNFDYPSRKHDIAGLAQLVHAQVENCCVDPSHKFHFVTHSLGGIVVRAYLQQHRGANLGRVVMLSPPNQGSEIVDLLRDFWLYLAVMGPAAQQLGTDSASVPNVLGPVTFSLGVITGNHSLNPFSSWLIPGADDGKVAVERAKVEGMADFLVVPYGHTFIMSHKMVAEQAVHFLRTGHFRRATHAER